MRRMNHWVSRKITRADAAPPRLVHELKSDLEAFGAPVDGDNGSVTEELTLQVVDRKGRAENAPV